METAVNITNSTNPYVATVNGIKIVTLACLPPNIKYPVKCAILFAQIGVSICTGGTSSMVSTALVIGSARQILENSCNENNYKLIIDKKFIQYCN